MRPLLVLAFALTACAATRPPAPRCPDATTSARTAAPEPARAPVYEVHFSPHGGCTEQTVKYINLAQHSVRVQAYSFTSEPIAQALLARHAAGVDVQVILDRSDVTERDGVLAELEAAGVPVTIDAKHPISHNKLVLADDRWVLTGSFNLSVGAEKNAENCLALDMPELEATYLDNWKVHRAHSEQPAAYRQRKER